MKIDMFLLPQSGLVPNNTQLPVLIYSDGHQSMDSAFFAKTFSTTGWHGIWKNGVYPYHHYRTSAHEVLGVGRGEAELQIGGPEGPVIRVMQGHCLLLPAGTGHMRVDSTEDFQVVGAYPIDAEIDVQRGAATNAMLKRIAALPIPNRDPLLGLSGGLREHWFGER